VKQDAWRASTLSSLQASIPMAIKYYAEFKKQITEKNRNLTLATIFSFSANEEEPEGLLPDEDFNMDSLTKVHEIS